MAGEAIEVNQLIFGLFIHRRKVLAVVQSEGKVCSALTAETLRITTLLAEILQEFYHRATAASLGQ